MPSVLIADDAAFMRMMIKNILTEAGYDIVGEAENGAVAVAKYRELSPDLTTMDITMPEMDGLAALKEIRGADPSARVRRVSRTGSTPTGVTCSGLAPCSSPVVPRHRPFHELVEHGHGECRIAMIGAPHHAFVDERTPGRRK